MATHSSTFAWKIPWMAELGAGHCPWGRKESGTTERFHFYDYTMEVRHRLKGRDLIDRVPDELWTEVHEIIQEKEM